MCHSPATRRLLVSYLPDSRCGSRVKKVMRIAQLNEDLPCMAASGVPLEPSVVDFGELLVASGEFFESWSKSQGKLIKKSRKVRRKVKERYSKSQGKLVGKSRKYGRKVIRFFISFEKSKKMVEKSMKII